LNYRQQGSYELADSFTGKTKLEMASKGESFD
jgi:hypothetical protein